VTSVLDGVDIDRRAKPEDAKWLRLNTSAPSCSGARSSTHVVDPCCVLAAEIAELVAVAVVQGRPSRCEAWWPEDQGVVKIALCPPAGVSSGAPADMSSVPMKSR